MSVSTEDALHVAINIPEPGIQTCIPLLPLAKTLLQASRLSIQECKPIYLDYYISSYNQQAFIGEDIRTHMKILMKSSQEFTSIIHKIYRVDTDLIIMTENSLYLVHDSIKKRKIYASFP